MGFTTSATAYHSTPSLEDAETSLSDEKPAKTGPESEDGSSGVDQSPATSLVSRAETDEMGDPTRQPSRISQGVLQPAEIIEMENWELAPGRIREVSNRNPQKGEPEFLIGLYGVFRVKPGVACTVKNRLYIDAILQVIVISSA
ncbi:hypothetical protein QBC47DRAFT_362141 [Echria macrotheca]|uniref:Uncharacterized protein n=1 Tax=Echria macrotheca TaxID=438768 RepID=A0AAJ0BBT5_9PEZI|nr:hypothetical protein QBC47DRAFT_362141 [Echria macrotheca]